MSQVFNGLICLLHSNHGLGEGVDVELNSIVPALVEGILIHRIYLGILILPQASLYYYFLMLIGVNMVNALRGATALVLPS